MSSMISTWAILGVSSFSASVLDEEVQAGDCGWPRADGRKGKRIGGSLYVKVRFSCTVMSRLSCLEGNPCVRFKGRLLRPSEY
jgi:hypothetical protein